MQASSSAMASAGSLAFLESTVAASPTAGLPNPPFFALVGATLDPERSRAAPALTLSGRLAKVAIAYGDHPRLERSTLPPRRSPEGTLHASCHPPPVPRPCGRHTRTDWCAARSRHSRMRAYPHPGPARQRLRCRRLRSSPTPTVFVRMMEELIFRRLCHRSTSADRLLA